MSLGEWCVWWKGFPSDQPRSSLWTSRGVESFQQKETKATGRDRLPGPVPDWADDLFRVARAVFVADKTARRVDSADGWTRRIRLSVPVTDPAAWADDAALRHLHALLETLTADLWTVEFRALDRTRAPVEEALELAEQHHASEVALFSGGLDSLCWAATRAAAADTERDLLLVRFGEINMISLQERVFRSAQRLAPNRRLHLHNAAQYLKGDDVPGRYEQSSRTRGVLYVAAAVRAATGHGVSTVHVPENGQVALNPPLTPARIAACSTRSVHPWTLFHLNELLTAVSSGSGEGVRVRNPFRNLTKGEVCAAGLTSGLTALDLAHTVSCGYPPVRRRGKQTFPNCGTCFPCLVRRSGMLRATNGDETVYQRQPWALGQDDGAGRDWQALQRWLDAPFTVGDLLADTPMPDAANITDAMAVITRGRAELTSLCEFGRGAAE